MNASRTVVIVFVSLTSTVGAQPKKTIEERAALWIEQLSATEDITRLRASSELFNLGLSVRKHLIDVASKNTDPIVRRELNDIDEKFRRKMVDESELVVVFARKTEGMFDIHEFPKIVTSKIRWRPFAKFLLDESNTKDKPIGIAMMSHLNRRNIELLKDDRFLKALETLQNASANKQDRDEAIEYADSCDYKDFLFRIERGIRWYVSFLNYVPGQYQFHSIAPEVQLLKTKVASKKITDLQKAFLARLEVADYLRDCIDFPAFSVEHNTVEVVVEPRAKSIVLFLGSEVGVNWKITAKTGVEIPKIVLIDNRYQDVLNTDFEIEYRNEEMNDNFHPKGGSRMIHSTEFKPFRTFLDRYYGKKPYEYKVEYDGNRRFDID
jgi:hypothetical protein